MYFELQQRFTHVYTIRMTHVHGTVDNVSFHREIYVFMFGFLNTRTTL